MYDIHVFPISSKFHTHNNDVYCLNSVCACVCVYNFFFFPPSCVLVFCVQVVVDTAQIENKEAYAPQITLEGSRVVVQVPSTW